MSKFTIKMQPNDDLHNVSVTAMELDDSCQHTAAMIFTIEVNIKYKKPCP